MKKTMLAAAALAIAASFSAGSAGTAHASSTCANGLDPNCNPGPGWYETWIVHHTSSFDYAVESSGTVLDPVAEQSDCPIRDDFYWWFRYVNSGTGIQFVIDGNDGNFHALGFSGNSPGKFKLESGVTGWYLSLHDASGFNWSYTDNSGSYFMDSPDQVASTYLHADPVSTTPSPTHWVLVTPPAWPGGTCVTA